MPIAAQKIGPLVGRGVSSSAAKAGFFACRLAARLKACPFKTGSMTKVGTWGDASYEGTAPSERENQDLQLPRNFNLTCVAIMGARFWDECLVRGDGVQFPDADCKSPHLMRVALTLPDQPRPMADAESGELSGCVRRIGMKKSEGGVRERSIVTRN